MAFPASVGQVTLADTYVDVGNGDPIIGLKIVILIDGFWADSADSKTIVGGVVYGVINATTNATGQLKKAVVGGGTPTEDVKIPVYNDPDLDQPVYAQFSEYFNGATNPFTWTLAVDTAAAGTTINLRDKRRLAVNPNLNTFGVPASQAYVQAQIALLGSIPGLVDGNGIILSSKIQVAAVSLSIPGVLAVGSQSIASFAFNRPITHVQLEVDEPSLAGNIVATVTWEERATGTTHTTTGTLTSLTELTDTLAVSWGHYNVDGSITGAPMPGDLGYVTVTSTGSQYGGRNLRVTLLGNDAVWPSELAAPGTLASASITSGVLTATAGTGICPNIFVTTGTGGSEQPLGQTTSGGSVFPVGASVDVSAVPTNVPVNVYPANRDNLGSTAVILQSYTYLYVPSGSSVDTTKAVVASTNGTVTCSGGYLVAATGNATNFLAADRCYFRLQSATSTDLSLAVLNHTQVFQTVTAMSFDFYYRGTLTDDNYVSGSSYQFQFQPINGTWTWRKHVSGVTTVLSTGSLPTIGLSTDWTARIAVTAGHLHTVKVWATAGGESGASTLLNAVSDSSVTAAGKLLWVAEGPGTGGAVRTLKLGTSAVA